MMGRWAGLGKERESERETRIDRWKLLLPLLLLFGLQITIILSAPFVRLCAVVWTIKT